MGIYHCLDHVNFTERHSISDIYSEWYSIGRLSINYNYSKTKIALNHVKVKLCQPNICSTLPMFMANNVRELRPYKTDLDNFQKYTTHKLSVGSYLHSKHIQLPHNIKFPSPIICQHCGINCIIQCILN